MRRIPIRAYVGGLFVILTLAIGLSMTVLFYGRMKSAIAATTSDLFDRTATLVSSEIRAERSQIALALAFAAHSDFARVVSLPARPAAIDVLYEELDASPWVVAAYVGYPNGDFMLLRRRPPGQSSIGALPAATRFVLQLVQREDGKRVGSYVFYDATLHRLGERVDASYRYDPRTRPWFHAGTQTPSLTPPYLFFTTRKVGITMSLRAASGSVLGADIDFGSVSERLAALRPTPSAVAAIVTGAGEVIAYSDTRAFEKLARLAGSDRAPNITQLNAPPLTAGYAAAAASPNAQGTYRDSSGRLWLFRVTPVLTDTFTPRVLVIGVPEDELFGAATRVRNEALLLSLALVLIWIPLTLWLSRFVSQPLRELRTDAVALRNYDFTDRAPPASIIAEIAEFSSTFDAMRRHIRQHQEASTRFIPREFLRQLERADILSLQLGDHVLREMTILFSDIRSFTALSESMSPQQTFNFVNSYLTRVGPIIRDHGGFIDKYIGDAIMGLFPEHPQSAVDAAIAMQRRVVVYNEERARAGYPPIAIGIGLHSGDLMLGTIGEALRFETTVIADAVNVAARLESLTKTFKSLILASGAVIDRIDTASYRLRRLGDVQVMGTTRGITIVEVCDADPPEKLAHKMRTAATFEQGRIAYAGGEFAVAHRLFAEVAADDENDHGAVYFRDRAAVMAAATQSAWDGVEKMEAK